MQELLDQSQRTDPAADRAAQNRAEKQENAHHIPSGSVAGRRQRILQSPERTCADCSGTGIAVKARDAGVFGLTLIDLTIDETLQVRIVKQRAVELDQSPGRRTARLPPICSHICFDSCVCFCIHIVTPDLHTLYRS